MSKKCGRGRKAKNIYKDIKLKKVWWRQSYLMANAHLLTQPIQKTRKAVPTKYIKKLLLPPAEGSSYVNLLTVNNDVINFSNGAPVDYSQLVPYIKIYKVFVRGKEEVEQVLLPFQAYQDFEEWKSNAAEGGASRLFRGREAGIQNLDIKMEGRGRNPVSANVMHVDLKLYFNDIQTLFAPIAVDGRKNPVTYSDLIRYPASLKNSKVYGTPTSFRIRIELGWSANTAAGEVSTFKKAANNARISIICDMYTNQIEFNQDGSVSLTAKYKGALESTFSGAEADIMAASHVTSQNTIGALNAKIKKLDDTFIESFRNVLVKAAPVRGRLNKVIELEKQLDIFEGEITQLAEQNKLFQNGNIFSDEAQNIIKNAQSKIDTFYQNFENRQSAPTAINTSFNTLEFGKTADLIRKRQISKSHGLIRKKESKVSRQQKRKVAILRKKYLKQRRLAINEMKRAKRRAKAQHIFKYVEKMMESGKMAYIHSSGARAPVALVNYEKYWAQKIAGANKTTLSRTARNIVPPSPRPSASGKAKKPAPTPGSTTYTSKSPAISWPADGKRIKYVAGDKLIFFTLGDLLTQIFEEGQFGNNLEELSPNFRLLLGEYDYEDLQGNDIRASLYDLPISLEVFSNFLAQKIMGSGRGTYPLLQFLFDLIKFVMDKLLGTFGAAAQREVIGLRPVNFKLDMTTVDLPEIKNIKDFAIPIGAGSQKTTKKIKAITKTGIKNMSNTFVIHAQKSYLNGEENGSYKGDLDTDTSRGILHFFVGGPNRGLLKNIRFTEANNPLFSTALMRNGQSMGDVSSGAGIIKPSKYACELTLVGNPFFFIGQMFYVNTSLISSGHFAKENILNGGYYIVVGVESTLRNSTWETTIRGVLNIPDRAMVKGVENMSAIPIRPLRTMDESERTRILAKQQASQKGTYGKIQTPAIKTGGGNP